MIARARILNSFVWTGVDPIGTDIPILSGNVNQDATADVRATIDLTTDGNRTWPANASGLLTPYGNELFVERGIDYGDGTREWVSLGYFRIEDVQQTNVPNGAIRLAGRDRMAVIIDARLTNPVEFTAGTTIRTVFETLVGEAFPATVTIHFDFDADTATLATTQVAEQDRYGFLRDIARSRGKVMFWDYAGNLRIEDPPHPHTPVFEVNSGADGVLVSMARSLNRDGVYNAVVATGQSTTDAPPVRAVARDINPKSTTFWDGPFGKVPRFYFSPLITTVTQAESAAAAILAQSLGLPYNVDFAAIPNPALEVLDPIRVTHPDNSELHLLERLTISLVARDAMSGTTREKTDMQIGLE